MSGCKQAGQFNLEVERRDIMIVADTVLIGLDILLSVYFDCLGL